MERIDLVFGELCPEQALAFLPHIPGVYCVFRGIQTEDRQYEVRELLYIGQGNDLRNHILLHEKWPDWRGHASFDEQIILTMARADDPYARERAEAALIHAYRPPLNTDYVERFPFPRTILMLAGPVTQLAGVYVVRDVVEDAFAQLAASQIQRR